MLYHYISLIFCLFLIYSTIFGSDNPSKNTSKYLNAGKKIRIIENKGQWHSNVNYKTKVPNGALFFENNAFTYLFFDGKARHFGHSHHDNKDTNSGHKNARRKFNTNPKDSVKLPEKVQYHAYQMKFKGGKAKRITGEDSYNTRFN